MNFGQKIKLFVCGVLLYLSGLSMAAVVDKDKICIDDDGQVAQQSISAEVEKECFISYEAVAHLLNQVTIIDTRLTDEYEQYFIPGSLNIPANQIKIKKYLQQDSLLIVGNGFNDSAMLGLCASLDQQGFQHVQVLNGGMLAWLAQGGAVSGFPPVNTSLLSATAADVSREYHGHRAVLISLNSALQKQMQQLGYDTILLPGSANKSFPDWFKTTYAEKSSYPVFVGSAKEIEKQKSKIAGEQFKQTVFYLDDAYAALAENKKQIDAFAKQREKNEHLGAVCGR